MAAPQPGQVQASGRRALVAGASGLVGNALLQQLLQATAPGGAVDDRKQSAFLYRSVEGLRRTPGRGFEHKRLRWHDVDFQQLPTLPEVDDVYIALGSTIKAAGSQAAFRQVDFDAVVATARAAHARGARRLAVVSALGAAADSAIFYNRVKGEMEAAVAAIGYQTLVLARPSLLLGDRSRLGQTARTAEGWGIRMLRPLQAVIPAAIRPIEAQVVARAMLRAMRAGRSGISVLSSRELQRSGAVADVAGGAGI